MAKIAPGGAEMSIITLKGIVRNGKVEVDAPINLPDGAEVTITGVDEDRPMTPEEIAATIAIMDQLEPVEMSDEELAAWETNRRRRIEEEKSKFGNRADLLGRLWE
jgi:hypothetical protein